MAGRNTTPGFRIIRAGMILLIVLLAVYIPLKIYITRSEPETAGGPLAGTTLSIFVTNELSGYREPCG